MSLVSLSKSVAMEGILSCVYFREIKDLIKFKGVYRKFEIAFLKKVLELRYHSSVNSHFTASFQMRMCS